jgi:hypothetical protein
MFPEGVRNEIKVSARAVPTRMVQASRIRAAGSRRR